MIFFWVFLGLLGIAALLFIGGFIYNVLDFIEKLFGAGQ